MAKYINYINPNNFDNKHRGQRGFVVGGGHSIRSLGDLRSLLTDEVTLSVNKSYEIVDPTYQIWNDGYFWNTFQEDLRNLKCTKFIPDDIAQAFDIDSSNTHVIRRDGGGGIRKEVFDTFHESLSWWNNTGVVSLRIAHILGLNPIYLVGIDLVDRDSEGNTHFHSSYSKEKHDIINQDRYNRFYVAYEYAIKPLLARGINVYSCSINSKLNNLIEYKDISEVMGIKND